MNIDDAKLTCYRTEDGLLWCAHWRSTRNWQDGSRCHAAESALSSLVGASVPVISDSVQYHDGRSDDGWAWALMPHVDLRSAPTTDDHFTLCVAHGLARGMAMHEIYDVHSDTIPHDHDPGPDRKYSMPQDLPEGYWKYKGYLAIQNCFSKFPGALLAESPDIFRRPKEGDWDVARSHT